MKERIQNVKVLFDLGIDRELFLAMVLHCTDHYEEKPPAYSNYLKIEKWKDLYAKKPHPALELNFEQLNCFFNYMSKYHSLYVGKNHDIFYVNKNFTNDLRHEINFEFESIVYYTLELEK
ncbi:hypothetical protein LZZ90_09940 [Flavobacterium sp. SM15]|uniref:hypothetical protein n=1 Tax=Flavobacterium sp. SM15 TaxID=2908005 RepID=UPI001EDB7595|nr:hypothetical protein [Flavobacterium sp. SM15]MCG2611824.1 hypothetical protein [Flavobacterium sp. SM15]